MLVLELPLAPAPRETRRLYIPPLIKLSFQGVKMGDRCQGFSSRGGEREGRKRIILSRANELSSIFHFKIPADHRERK